MAPKRNEWRNRICNPSQLGGIETSVLDNGPGRNTRIAWVSTGSPLRYRVVPDRGLDIADAFYGGASLAWLSHGGIVAPRPDANQGIEWLTTFGGGLVTTCGLTHMGPPEADAMDPRGLHGRYSNLPTEVVSITQPDLDSDAPEMVIRGIVRESRVFGPSLELYRTIRSPLGEASIHIEDEVVNRGSTPAPHMLLYHCNFGYPLVDAGTRILYHGECRSRGLDMDNAIFNEDCDYRTCSEPLESHRGGGEGCGFIDAQADADGWVHCGLHNAGRGLTLALSYPKQTLPALANWQHWGMGDYVTALEPGTNSPIGRSVAKERGELIMLEPGQRRRYELRFTVYGNPDDAREFLRRFD